MRLPVLSLLAFDDLRSMGVDAFLAQNDGDGWQLPETLRLADLDLGHDARAKRPQEVSSRLGSRFLDWQLCVDEDVARLELKLHAELIAQIMRIDSARVVPDKTPVVAEEEAIYKQGGLF